MIRVAEAAPRGARYRLPVTAAAPHDDADPGGSAVRLRPVADESGLPIRLLHDRVLVRLDDGEGERRSAAGIVIPATASVGRRLSWATAVGVGQHVRSIVTGDRVLFDPEDRSEVELHGRGYVLLRERDVHAVAATRVETDGTGLYL